MSTWKPIETAPQDGTYILVYPGGVVRWDWGDEAWMQNVTPLPDGVFYCHYAYPTHWMSLPDAPVTNMRACIVCGTEFDIGTDGRKASKVLCSDGCKMKAYRNRRKRSVT